MGLTGVPADVTRLRFDDEIIPLFRSDTPAVHEPVKVSWHHPLTEYGLFNSLICILPVIWRCHRFQRQILRLLASSSASNSISLLRKWCSNFFFSLTCLHQIDTIDTLPHTVSPLRAVALKIEIFDFLSQTPGNFIPDDATIYHFSRSV